MSERSFAMLLLDFRQWMLDERGLALRTRKGYSERVALAQRFLASEGRHVSTCTAGQLREAYLRVPATSASRNNTRSALLAFYAFLQATGRRNNNPAATLPYIRKARYLPRPFEAEEVERYRRAADALGGRYPLIASLGLDAGLRIFETAKTEWPDVGGSDLRVRGKGSVDRLVPVSGRLHASLRAWRPACASAQWLFPSRFDRRHVSTVSVLHWHHEVLEEAGLRTGVKGQDGYHRLRHTFATEALDAGDGDLLAVKELLGHASVATTQVYARLRTTRLAEVIKRMYVPALPEETRRSS